MPSKQQLEEYRNNPAAQANDLFHTIDRNIEQEWEKGGKVDVEFWVLYKVHKVEMTDEIIELVTQKLNKQGWTVEIKWGFWGRKFVIS